VAIAAKEVMKARFFCENCGIEVQAAAVTCPGCGLSFSAIRCPTCDYQGSAREFSGGCPACGYLVDLQRRGPGSPAPLLPPAVMKLRSPALSTGFYRILGVALVAILIGLLVLLLVRA
jgi:predicted RNA-binding Zn-ribbon protein involved in translation (DUF1610 family)